MEDHKKINILYLLPGPIYRPDLPDFFDRFRMLSESGFSGDIITWTTNPDFEKYEISNFTFYGFQKAENRCITKLKLFGFCIKKAWALNKISQIDAIICYEPMFTGLIGAILKVILKCKLVIEINSSNMKEALYLSGTSKVHQFFKIFFYNAISSFSLYFADAIKLLTEEQKEKYSLKYKKKKIVCFHDFVPTHCFYGNAGLSQCENTILFVGFPFYLKGVDVLINAFGKISKKYPDFKLKLIGHQLEENSGKYFREMNENIFFSKGVFYDKIRPEFEKCYCFVLPSRTEGMGRVLIEAMACGKSVIGSNVGGIPNVIQEGRNGFLFESENVDDLASKLDKLLSDPQLAMRMGEEGRRIVNEKFSSEKYVEHFKMMIDEVLNEKKRKG